MAKGKEALQVVLTSGVRGLRVWYCLGARVLAIKGEVRGARGRRVLRKRKGGRLRRKQLERGRRGGSWTEEACNKKEAREMPGYG